MFKSLAAREIVEFESDGCFASTVGRHHGEKWTIAKYMRGQGRDYKKPHEDKQIVFF
ncbi:MAG: hypothetical protein M2R45_00423 [Verrucomicrobia subdivision 3 bacterium]|nr:hypothetical protein [Limisphaerales bacterium]MCS1413697.1 hypothetical protein [Limisphaerales bacterium]